MTPQKQTVLSNPLKGTLGNCLSACIASLMDKPLSEVPHFVKEKDWFAYTYNWFHDNGYRFEQLQERAFHKVAPYEEYGGYVIVVGKSPRSGYHAVIYKDGEPFFDPHPDNTFIDGEPIDYVLIYPKAKGEANLYEYYYPQYLELKQAMSSENNNTSIDTATAVKTLTAAIREDPDFYQGYQANIAMAFYDTCINEGSQMERTALRELTNKAAKRFLDIWIKE